MSYLTASLLLQSPMDVGMPSYSGSLPVVYGIF